MTSKKYREGLRIRTDVIGKPLPEVDVLSRPIQELVVEYCWGSVWSRPGLALKTRSLMNIAILAALNRSHELKLHVRGALRNGCTEEEISEVLLQVTVYCGVPAGVDAVRAAQEAIAASKTERGQV